MERTEQRRGAGLGGGNEVYFETAYKDGADTVVTVGEVYVKNVGGADRKFVKIAINGKNVRYVSANGVKLEYGK